LSVSCGPRSLLYSWSCTAKIIFRPREKPASVVGRPSTTGTQAAAQQAALCQLHNWLPSGLEAIRTQTHHPFLAISAPASAQLGEHKKPICARSPITKLRTSNQKRSPQPKMVNKCAHELSVTESVCVGLVQATLIAIRLLYLGGLRYSKKSDCKRDSIQPSRLPGSL